MMFTGGVGLMAAISGAMAFASDFVTGSFTFFFWNSKKKFGKKSKAQERKSYLKAKADFLKK